MSAASTPTKGESKSTAITTNGDSHDDDDDFIIKAVSYAYRPLVFCISARYDPKLLPFLLHIRSLEIMSPEVRKPIQVSAIIFNKQQDKVLLLQRIHVPNTWEVPSCIIFDDDKSPLHALVRAVHLCSGQFVTNISRNVGFYDYESDPPGKPCRRYCFIAEVDHPEEEEVALWLDIYQSFAWVTEEEVNDERHRSEALDFHEPALRLIIQKAFVIMRNEQQAAMESDGEESQVTMGSHEEESQATTMKTHEEEETPRSPIDD
ncbi:hypothetical protein PG990_005140 [Apiospora arundinis]